MKYWLVKRILDRNDDDDQMKQLEKSSRKDRDTCKKKKTHDTLSTSAIDLRP